VDVTFFESPAALRAWLEAHYDRASELWIGFYKKGSGMAEITYAEALDEALCFGWIDGIRKGLDAASYTNRFTPRQRNSIWSAVNIRRVHELTAQGRMHSAGLRAFAARDEQRARQYSYERDSAELDADAETTFRANEPAWAFWQAQPPGYRRTATWWVISAKQPETRQRRLATLIEHSALGERLPQLTRPGDRAKPPR
jgi:uncharacterized protein YdeI (YjbR/CyaY-like superfamily)